MQATQNQVTEKQYQANLKAALKFTNKPNSVRPVLEGVFHQHDGSMIATNGTRLIRIENAHNKTESIILDKQQKEIPGQFPDMSRAIPQHFKTEIENVSVSEWLEGHELAYIIAKNKKGNNRCTLHLEPNHQVIISAEQPAGSMKHEFNCKTARNSDSLTIHYNCEYMIGAMKVLKTLKVKNCSIQFSGPYSPMIIKAENILILIMPVRKN